MSSTRGSEPQFNLELRDYLHVLRRRWKLIAVITLAVGALGATWTFTRTPVYESRAVVLLDHGYSRTVLAQREDAQVDLNAQVTTESDLMRSGPVLRRIGEEIGYEPEVRIVPQEVQDDSAPTRAIDVVSTATTADRAAQQATDFANAYVVVRRRLIQRDLDQNIEESLESLAGLDRSTAAARLRLAELETIIPTVTDEEERLTLEAERDRINFELNSERIAQRQNAIQTRIDTLQQARRLNRDTGVFKLNEAVPPSRPRSPVPVRDIGVSLLAGFGMALVAAFLRDYFDDSIGTKEELDQVTGSVPVLGIIPLVRRRRGELDELESLAHPSSGASEAYRSLRTALEFTGLGKELSLIHVTSAAPGEGKSTTACNLAVSLARAGNHVVLVDCDLRRPRVHSLLEVDTEVGFTSVLLGTTTMDQALQRVDAVPGLYVLPAGPIPPNPAEVLDSELAASRLRLLAQSADYVVIDSPPILPVSDSVALAAYTDVTLMVVRARTANRRAINRALEILEQIGSPASGMILNGVSHEATYGYGYGYGYSYSGYRRRRRGREPAVSRSAGDRDVEHAPPGAEPINTNGSAPAPEVEEPRVGERS